MVSFHGWHSLSSKKHSFWKLGGEIWGW